MAAAATTNMTTAAAKAARTAAGKPSAVTGGRDQILTHWDVGRGKPLRSFLGHRNTVTSAVFSRDGRRLLSGSQDKTVRLWDVNSGKELQNCVGHSDNVLSIALSGDARYALSGGADKLAILWVLQRPDLGEAETPAFEFISQAHFRTALNRVEKMLAAEKDRLGEDGCYRGLELRKQRECKALLATALAQKSDEQTGRLYRALTAETLCAEAGKTPLTALAISHAGGLIATGTQDGEVALWDAEGRFARNLKSHGGEVLSLAFSKNGKVLVSSGRDNVARTIELLDKNRDRVIYNYEDHKYPVTTVVFSPDGRYVLSGDAGGSLYRWSPNDGKYQGKYKGASYGITGLAVTPAGDYVLACTSCQDNDVDTLHPWTFKDHDWARKFQGFRKHLHSLAFKPDGKQALTGGDDGILRLWDFNSGREIRQFPGHRGAILSVAVSPDGRFAATGSRDMTVRLWDLEKGRETGMFEENQNVVSGVAFSADGLQVIIAGHDRTLRFWKVAEKK